MITDVKYKEICIGDTTCIHKTITEDSIIKFADITGDINPIHLDDAFASRTMFKKRIAHGMLTSSFISAVLGTKLPGANTLYLGQNLKFLAPVFIGDQLTTSVEVKEKKDEKQIIVLSTMITNQLGQKIVSGEAVVKKMEV
ncbi:MaoC family dehydratase [Clostridiaceae bacterium 35-E11]